MSEGSVLVILVLLFVGCIALMVVGEKDFNVKMEALHQDCMVSKKDKFYCDQLVEDRRARHRMELTAAFAIGVFAAKR